MRELPRELSPTEYTYLNLQRIYSMSCMRTWGMMQSMSLLMKMIIAPEQNGRENRNDSRKGN